MTWFSYPFIKWDIGSGKLYKFSMVLYPAHWRPTLWAPNWVKSAYMGRRGVNMTR